MILLSPSCSVIPIVLFTVIYGNLTFPTITAAVLITHLVYNRRPNYGPVVYKIIKDLVEVRGVRSIVTLFCILHNNVFKCPAELLPAEVVGEIRYACR